MHAEQFEEFGRLLRGLNRKNVHSEYSANMARKARQLLRYLVAEWL